LERIKAERAAAQAKKEQEEKDAAEKKNRESALKGNPLVNLDNSGSDKVKRRWNDDVVFRNQTRDEPEHKKRFINDTIRNDFHRNFLKKFMK
jgi:protein CWC15